MKNCHFERYEDTAGDNRLKLVVDSGEVFVLCTSINGSGEEVHRAWVDHPWLSGPNQYLGIFESRKEVAANGYVVRED